MTYLIIATVDAQNRPIRTNYAETQEAAALIVDKLHALGDTDAFAVEVKSDYGDVQYMTADVVAQTVTYSRAEEDAALLEESWTEVRRKRDRLLAESDWTQGLDTPVDANVWSVYRQELRDLPATGDITSLVYPAKPV